MGKTVNMTLRVPEELHIKMKILAAVQNKNMSELFISWLEKQNVTIPDFERKSKAVTKAKRKTVKSTKKDDPILKERIIALNAEGLTLSEIGEKLESDGIKTATGLDKWHKQTISRMLKRWGGALGGVQNGE